MSVGKFVGSGALLFVDYVLVAAGGWVYWLLISKVASPAEIGEATTVYSLVLLISMLMQLGLEYPLLKKSDRQEIAGTALFLEFIILIPSIPILMYLNTNLYGESLSRFNWLAIGNLISNAVVFVARFAILGKSSNIKLILVADIIGLIVKLASGYLLVELGFGALGMLASFFISTLVIACATLFAYVKQFGLKIGQLSLVREIITDGLINVPSKISKTVIFSLSVVLLAYLGISTSDVGVFYVISMIALAGGSMASSISLMSIPASSRSKVDLTSSSVRVGLSLCTPLIVVLVSIPGAILNIFGQAYSSAEGILLVLSIAILPFSIVTNAITRLNYLNASGKLIIIGAVEIVVFVVAFLILVPTFGTLGAAYSVLIAFICSCVPSIIWSERTSLKYTTNAALAIALGWAVGFVFGLLYPPSHPLITSLVSVGAAVFLLILLKNVYPEEIKRSILKVVRNYS